MARRKAAYRKRHQNRFSMFLVTLVVLMIMVVVAVRSVELQQKIAGYDTQIASLGAQIEAEQTRAEQIEEFGKYTQTKAYVEEVAKDKLGLVYEGEILFRKTIKQGNCFSTVNLLFCRKNEVSPSLDLTKGRGKLPYNRENRKGRMP